MTKGYLHKLFIFCSIVFLGVHCFTSCKSKKHILKTEEVAINDTFNGRCKLVHKNAKILTKHIKENSFDYTWIYAKANVQVKVDSEENSLDIRIRGKKDSAILITIDYLSLVPVAKVLITRDSVKMRIDVKKQYFIGDFNYINELLTADLDFDMIQAVLFGNSAEYYDDDETKLKPVTDRQNCHYLLTTERKHRLRRTNPNNEVKKSLQTMTLNPDNYKILKNEFIDVLTNRMFSAVYEDFTVKDSVYAPHHVNIDIVAEKKVNLKIDYVRIEKNQTQKLSLNIPAKYEPIPVKKPK